MYTRDLVPAITGSQPELAGYLRGFPIRTSPKRLGKYCSTGVDLGYHPNQVYCICRVVTKQINKSGCLTVKRHGRGQW